MCGIFAVWSKKKGPKIALKNNHELLKGIFSLQHRGPDSSVVQQLAPYCLLAFHRLAINGLNNVSNQPLQLGSTWVICNGQIYNHVSLAKKYGFTPLTDNDCECILHLYKYFGGDLAKVVPQLDGAFAFVLYDAARDRLCVGNDPLGVRPIYWNILQNDEPQYFASEPVAIAHLVGQVDFFPHGCYWSSDSESTTCYFPLFTLKKLGMHQWTTDNVETICAKLETLMGNAVFKRLMSDRPMGFMLSGGFDSTLVLARAVRYMKPGTQVNVFTIAMSSAAPDLIHAKMAIDFFILKYPQLKFVHYLIELSEQDFLLAVKETVIVAGTYDITTIRAMTANRLVGKYISENTDCKVVFNGDLSDEQWGSYLECGYAPDPNSFWERNYQLMDEVFRYDILRSARSMSYYGLDPYTPFEDNELITYVMSIPSELKMFSRVVRNPGNALTLDTFVPKEGFGIEKFLLRKAHAHKEYMPEAVLWRKKEAFSDGISHQKRSWYQILAEHLETVISNEELAAAPTKYPHCTPKTKEALYYRNIHEECLGPSCSQLVDKFWMPRFIDSKGDPSARVLPAYTS